MSTGLKPAALGASLSVVDSDALAALSTDGLTIGTKCFNADVDAYFALTVSTDAPVTDDIVLANGLSNGRWIKDAGGGGSVVPSLDHFVQLSAPSNIIALTDLNGDLEGDYLIDCVLIGAAVNANFIQFMINGAATNLVARSGDWLVGSSYRTDWYFANTGPYPLATAAVWSITGRLTAKSGRLRQLQVTAFANDSNHDYLFIAGQLTDNAPVITGFSVVCDIDAGMVAGSYLRLTPLNTAQA